MRQIDLLSISDHDRSFLEQLSLRAIKLAESWQSRTMPQTLAGARIGSIAELPGWRNPTALALGIQAMGGTCVTIDATLEGAETVRDLAGYIDNWFDLLAVRTPRLSRLQAFADALDAPVMNLRTNDNHPCEILGDLSYVLSQRGSWDGLRVAMVGPAGNIARSWFEAAEVLPIEVKQVAPPHLWVSQSEYGQPSGATDDLNAIEDAELIITDCWPPQHDIKEQDTLSEFRIDAALLNRCRPDVLFLPCPPVTRGEEVSADAMLHPRSLSKPAKAYLMHIQNAYLEKVLN